jgi:hypothetical protein
MNTQPYGQAAENIPAGCNIIVIGVSIIAIGLIIAGVVIYLIFGV